MTMFASSRKALRGWLGVAAAAAVLLPLSIAPVRAHPLYDTTRLLEQQGNACLKPAQCRTIVGKKVAIRKGEAAVLTMRCPTSDPYFQGWDVRRHEHIQVTLTEQRTVGLKVIAVNQADAAGSVTLVIGCSSRPTKPTSIMQSAGGFPTKLVRTN